MGRVLLLFEAGPIFQGTPNGSRGQIQINFTRRQVISAHPTNISRNNRYKTAHNYVMFHFILLNRMQNNIRQRVT